MRVSTWQLQQRALDMMLEQQTRLVRTQQQVATGQRILTPAEDPAGTIQGMRLDREIAGAEQYQDNAETARARQTTEENVLTSVTELLHEVSDLVIQGNSDTMTASDRHALAAELDRRLEELLGLANTRHGGGEYLFAGGRSTTQPFSHDGRGDFRYHGDQSSRTLSIGPGVTVAATTPGSEVFQGVPEGNGTFVTSADPANTGGGVISAGAAVGTFVPDDYRLAFTRASPDDPLAWEVRDGSGALVAGGEYSSGASIQFNGAEVAVSGAPVEGDAFHITPAGHRDMFSVIHGVAEVMRGALDGPGARTGLHNALNRGMAELSGALEHVLLQRARAGSRLNLIEAQGDANDAFLAAAKSSLSDVRDLDYAEATVRLEAQKTGLQAAMQSYALLQGLSLFNYLR